MKTKSARQQNRWALLRAACIALVTGAMAPMATASVTDIATDPLTTADPNVVKPNLLYILDDSGSMASNYMPDDANFETAKYGLYAAQCNGLAYNPSINYPVPVNSDGTPKADGTYTFITPAGLNNIRTINSAAPAIATGNITVTLSSFGNGDYRVNDYVTLFDNSNTSRWMLAIVTAVNTGAGTLTLKVTETAGTGSLTNGRIGDGHHRPFYYTYTPTTGSPAALSYTYNSTGVITTTTLYQECDSVVDVAPGNGRFTRTLVTSSSTELQKYSNWYTYYRTRMLMMKTSTSIAFASIGNRFRVGFTTISSKTVDGSKFLDVSDFDATQKSAWYTTLFAATTGSSTPLRGALSKAGQYYAKKGRLGTAVSGSTAQIYDPVQYSCQKNFAILTTDGYWNIGSESTSSPKYGPYQLDNTTNVAQQDGAVARPMQDGATAATSTVTTWDTTRTKVTKDSTTTTTYPGATTTTTNTYSAGTGSRTDSYSGFKTNSSVVRCGGGGGACTITVTTSAAHGFAPGAKVTIVDAAPAAYNGTWTLVTASGSTYTFSMASRPAGNTTPGRTLSAGTCSAGYGTVTRASTQADTYPLTITTATTATKTDTTAYTQNQQLTVTPFTRTVVVSGGATFSDTTTSGTPTVTNAAQTPPPNTVVTSAYAPTPTSNAGSAAVINTSVGAAPLCSNTATNGTVSATPVSTKPATTSSTVATTIASTTGATTTSTLSDNTVTGPSTVATLPSSVGGTSDTLADVAMYYYSTDLRDSSLSNCTLANGTNVCENNVSPRGADTATHQHMSTFTVGLGVNGLIGYASNYLAGGSADFQKIIAGTKDWPTPADGKGAENIDDLWHAAVNGRGQYFSATNPTTLATSLGDALKAIEEIGGSGSGAAASTLQPVAGDNSLFIATYTTVAWTGDLVAREINPETGAISTTNVWSAQQVLDARVAAGTARNIYYMRGNSGANTGSLVDFDATNLGTDGLIGNFSMVCSKTIPLTQCATGSYDVAGANTAANLIAYLRGASDSRFRTRTHVLGDIVGGAPTFVRVPSFKYTENNYAAFVATVNATNSGAGRTGVVYVAANDGMLHAFNGSTGAELWAYVPTMVMDRMYRLADTDYAWNHQFLVNAAPVVGDIYVGGQWKTILVGGLGAGGRGYYALDITNPNSPQALWEFKNNLTGGNNNLGLTFGNPVITKRSNGTWVVAFTSGYNNVSPGDGNGRLFIVDANTGERLVDVPTTVAGVDAGSTGTPSGLGKLNAWVESEIDNSARRFYAGDLLGNLWRFDIDGLVAPNNAALRLAYFRGGSPAAAQPITTQPVLGQVTYGGTNVPVVYVGTGRLLGLTDLPSTAKQAIYAVKDPLTNTELGDVGSSSSIVVQTLSESAPNAPRTITNNAVDWSTKNGWRVELLSAGERINVDMQLIFQTLTIAGNTPHTDQCTAGSSYLYELDLNTGSALTSNSGVAGTWLGGTMVVGMSFVTLQLPGSERGTGRTVTILVDNRGLPRIDDVPPPPPPVATGRRTSWRELVN